MCNNILSWSSRAELASPLARDVPLAGRGVGSVASRVMLSYSFYAFSQLGVDQASRPGAALSGW